MSRQVKIIAAGSVSLAALALALHGPSSPPQGSRNLSRSPSSVSDASGASGTQNAAQAGSGLELHFRPLAKTRYVYGFNREIAFSGLTGKSPKLSYQGELSIDVVSVNEQGFEGVITDQVVEYGKTSPTALRIQVDERGESVQFFSNSEKSDDINQHQSILKDLIAQWIFTLKKDTVGEYEANYDHFQKEKTRYLDAKGVLPKILSSHHQLVWDAVMNLPKSVEGKEKTLLSSLSKVEAFSAYKIQFLRTEALSGATAMLSNLTVAENFDLTSFSAHRQAKPFDMNSLQSINRIAPEERMNLFGELLAALRAGTLKPDDLLASLKSQGAIAQVSNSQLFKTIVGALASLGTPEAQAAVVALYQSPDLPVSGKGSILAALTTTQASLDSTTRAFLSNEISTQANPDLASDAAYALGAGLAANSASPANSPGSTDPQTTSQINQLAQLWSTASSAGNTTQELSALDAMGNSGRPEYLGDITGVIDNESNDAQLRAKAVFALRYMSSESATQLLSNSLGDSANAVRLAAVQAMNVAPWNDGFRSSLSSCVASEAVAEIRSACQTILTKNS